jgi:hypothetical protein
MRAALFSCGLALALAAGVGAAPQDSVVPPPSARVQPPAENSVERWNSMPPDVRERELAKLPPWRAARIRERIRRYNQLPPQERQVLNDQRQILSELPPARQALVRQRLREFRQLPQERRIAVRAAIDRIGALPPAQRQNRFANPGFQSRFSPGEQQIIKDMTENFSGFPR